MSKAQNSKSEKGSNVLEDVNSVQFHFGVEKDITEGSETESILDAYKNKFVEISELITEKQFNDILNAKYIQTYIKLRKVLSKSTISFIIRLIKTLYEQIQAIKTANFTKSKQADQIEKLLTDAKLCGFIDGTKKDLLRYASDLGIPITSNTDENVICYLLLGTITTDINYIITKMIETEYFNPDKKGLPDKLSDLTPHEIASIIDEKVLKLNGPIYGALLVPKEEFTRILDRAPPVFWFLGDRHIGNNECETCPMGTCFTLYKNNPTFYNFLANLAKSFNISIDLFLEYWISQQYADKNSVRTKFVGIQNSALIQSNDLMDPCTAQRKENELRRSCFFTEFRTHNADIRKTHAFFSDKYDADVILYTVNLFTKTYLADNSKTKSAAHMLSSRYPGFNVYEELLSLYSAKDNVESINRYFSSPFFKKYSRTLHEFDQLRKDVQSGLMEQLLIAAENNETQEYMISDDPSIRTEMVTALTDFIGDNSKSNETKLQLVMEKASESYEYSLGVSLVDIYTLSRALKAFKGGFPSQLSVIFQGDAHIQNQIFLLQNYYDVVQIWEGGDGAKTKCLYKQIFHGTDNDGDDDDDDEDDGDT